MSAERCYWNKYSDGHQCSADAVGPRAEKLGNCTDKWVWCQEHGGVQEQPRIGGQPDGECPHGCLHQECQP